MKKAILIIDPQCDFTFPMGSLYVKGAERDMDRLSSFVAKVQTGIEDVFVTMDSHREMHISHPNFWQDKKGRSPVPFTVITYAEAKARRWSPRLNNELSIDYLRQLEEKGKTHIIWPLHCIVGTEGYKLHPNLKQVLIAYAAKYGEVHIIHKGDCMFTEHFSALRAEVENDMFPESKLNVELIRALNRYTKVFLAGECADICVRETLRDLCYYAPSVTSKLIILHDCMSPIDTTFSFDNDEVYQRAVALGAEIADSEHLTSSEWK